jgi:uncharacterized protein YcsI (UPF0317 family)
MSVATLSHPKIRDIADPREVRRLIRTGAHADHTNALAPGHVQANIVILPSESADDFLRFCQRNPKPCPLLAVSDPGDPRLPELGEDMDIRSDVPGYHVFRDGAIAETVGDIGDLWRDDLVTFALGCSFSFEEALVSAGLPLPHFTGGGRPHRYNSSIDTVPAGPFRGKVVVTMRHFTPADAIRAIQITSRFPNVHGAPVHVGLPHLIGIDDIAADDKNGNGPIPDDHVPLFWACGVTPQLAMEEAALPFAITHVPGLMLVTDRLNASLSVF